MDSVELFTGCGGLALGLSRAGFRSLRMSEWDKHSVTNIEHNRSKGLSPVTGWPIHKEDVQGVDWSKFEGIDVVAGGPPCQPFSIGGRHRGHSDSRDMWPEAVRAVREAQPRAFLFENVREGLRFQYETNYAEIHGKPDLVFPRHKKAIFVHGCFWHQHSRSSCWRSRIPKTRREFWIPKLEKNAVRDKRQIASLRKSGWSVLVVWECETTATRLFALGKRIERFLKK